MDFILFHMTISKTYVSEPKIAEPKLVFHPKSDHFSILQTNEKWAIMKKEAIRVIITTSCDLFNVPLKSLEHSIQLVNSHYLTIILIF